MPLSKQQFFCTQCGTELSEGDKFCFACGALVKATAAPKTSPAADTAQQGSYRNISGKSVRSGDIIAFGNCDQGNGIAPIEWLVLSEDGEEALVISKLVLDQIIYSPDTGEEVYWSNCSLRKYLNEEFYLSSFSTKEQRCIVEHRLSTVNTGDHHLSTEITTDKIFCLDQRTVQGYFRNGSMAAKATELAIQKRVHTDWDNDCAYWWLRNPGEMSNYAMYVLDSGKVDSEGIDSHTTCIGIRPAMYIRID